MIEYEYKVRRDGVFEVPISYWFGGHLGYRVEINDRRGRKIVSNEDLEKLEESGIIKILKRYENKNNVSNRGDRL